MRSPGSRARASAVIAVIAVAATLAGAAPRADAAAARAALPARSYAPYFETWTKDQLPAVARQSGSRYFTLAFLQAPRKGSCVLSWNGDPGQTVAGGRFLQQIARLRAVGGDVVPSFGGFSADHVGTEIADSCASVAKIAQAYESVVIRSSGGAQAARNPPPSMAVADGDDRPRQPEPYVMTGNR